MPCWSFRVGPSDEADQALAGEIATMKARDHSEYVRLLASLPSEDRAKMRENSRYAPKAPRKVRVTLYVRHPPPAMRWPRSRGRPVSIQRCVGEN
jgi:hypothetical protein